MNKGSPLAVWIDYTNHRGERGWRQIEPYECKLLFTTTRYHPEQQWLLTAWDVEKQAERTFAMKDIHAWRVEGDLTQWQDEHTHPFKPGTYERQYGYANNPADVWEDRWDGNAWVNAKGTLVHPSLPWRMRKV